MKRDFYIDLAQSGARMPIGTDLVLHEHADAEAIRHDGPRLGEVIIEAARRYDSRMAIPLMDLTLEKSAMVEMLGVDGGAGEYHFSALPDAATMKRFEEKLAGPLPARLQAHIDSIGHVARHGGDLITCGMSIGPVSLMTKMLAEPITPIMMAGSGTTAEDDEEVALMEMALDLSLRLVLRSVEEQIKAGAKIIMIAEPATNNVFFSPRQIRKGSDVYERYAMAPNRKIRALLSAHGIDLFFHCCGELIDEMVSDFGSLDPAMLSLGSSRKLWEDARLLPKTTVLYGNLPSKRFYSDTLISADDVKAQSAELIQRMKEVDHPFVLGTECDVLNVPGAERSLKAKVDAMMAAF